MAMLCTVAGAKCSMNPRTILTTNSIPEAVLYRRWVKHDADRGTEGFRRKRVSEFCSHDTRVTVWSRHLAPNHSNFRPSLLRRGLVDIGDLFAQVERGRLGVIDPLNLDQARLRVCVSLSTLITQVTTLDV